jgi:single-strand DNA-binding protein
MSSLNKVQLIGRLGADPEVRSFQNGGKVANLRIATSQKWKDRNTGEKRERTEWHQVSILNEARVGVVEKYCRKGGQIYVEGALETRKWQDQSGNDRYSTEVVVRPYGGEIVLLGGAPDGQRQGGGGGGYDQGGQGGGQGGGQSGPRDLDDAIPF